MTTPEDELDRLLRLARQERPGSDFLSRLDEAANQTRAYRSSQARLAWVWGGLGAVGFAAAVAMLFLARRPEAMHVSPEPVEAHWANSAAPKEPQTRPNEKDMSAETILSQKNKRLSVKPASSRKDPAPMTLSQELDVLGDVRRTLANGDAQGALSRLDRNKTELGRGQMKLEAELLRIEALNRSGRRVEANALATKFVEEYPNSPLVDRARTFVITEKD